MKALVLSLDDAKYRHVEQQCKKLGIECEKMPGIRGSSLASEDLNALNVNSMCQYACTPAMIGISLGHMAMWKKAVESGDAYTMILEEDVEFGDPKESVMDLVEDALRQGPADMHVLLLACFNCPTLDKSDAPVKKTYIFGGTHAYIVTQKGAQFLVENVPKVLNHIDVHMSFIPGLKLYQMKKHVAGQDFTESSTASYGFPNTVPWYWTHAAFLRLGSYHSHVTVNPWSIVMLFMGYLGAPWLYVIGAYAVDAIVSRTVLDPRDVLVKFGFFAVGSAFGRKKYLH